MMWWAWTWLTGWWATNPSRALAPLPMCLQMCERIEGEREEGYLAAAGISDPTIQCVKFLRLWASKHGFSTLATVWMLCMLMLPACACEQKWPVLGQMYTKYCSRLALERAQRLFFICSNNKDFCVGDLKSSLQLLAK